MKTGKYEILKKIFAHLQDDGNFVGGEDYCVSRRKGFYLVEDESGCVVCKTKSFATAVDYLRVV